MRALLILRIGFSLFATAATLSPAHAAGAPKSFTSVNLDLPFGDSMFPDGPGSDAINNDCLACHSTDMVLHQPRLPRATWQAEVTKMRDAYKAPVSDEDAAAIVDYLARAKGK